MKQQQQNLCSLLHSLQFSFIYNDVKRETRAWK